jgi:arginine/serine-rich splicing factor 4/5/6
MTDPEEGRVESKEPEGNGEVIGSAALRPVFLGNLIAGYSPDALPDDVIAIFERPIAPPDTPANDGYSPMPVDRVDVKRGYCFVFLKDALSEAAKEQTERFVLNIHGM